jgi:hypothetical protein
MKFAGVLFFSISLFFVFLSCDTNYYSVIVRNNSSEIVQYTFNDSPNTLNLGESKEYQIEAYTPGPRDISVKGTDVMKVKMETRASGEEYIFIKAKPLILNVENKLNYDIILMADNYIEANPPSGKTSLQVSAQSNSTGITNYIYTDIPRFTIAPPGDSPIIEWTITGNTMNVTIKKR